MRFAYLVTEGPHDVEAIGRVLKLYGIKRVEKLEDLNPIWITLIPKTFPPDGNLLKRVPIPVFFQNEQYSIAVHAVGGITKLVKRLRLTLLNVIDKEENNDKPFSIGIFADADSREAIKCCDQISESLCEIESLPELKIPGEVKVLGNKRIGIHVFPNNKNIGTLDDALLECAEVVYPDLLKAVDSYIETIDEVYRKKWGISDQSKVRLGCIANVLRPGKSNQVSIQDNEWISEKTMQVSLVSELNKFINDLILN
ncbi:DUF3226 domain-containing protein [Paenibacillus medicaginis]|uniref:DUF3226 domain-containing protein n=1 Tax=Paenibacillus medicaginis TaxID=1470560 RepID=A0ABV5BXR9_9BACL